MIVTGMTRVIVPVHSVHVMTGVHVVAGAFVIVWPAGCAAVVTLLNLVDQVVLLVTLALVRRAVAFATGVVVADTHHRVGRVGCAIVFSH
jgi:hypothetical protein